MLVSINPDLLSPGYQAVSEPLQLLDLPLQGNKVVARACQAGGELDFELVILEFQELGLKLEFAYLAASTWVERAAGANRELIWVTMRTGGLSALERRQVVVAASHECQGVEAVRRRRCLLRLLQEWYERFWRLRVREEWVACRAVLLWVFHCGETLLPLDRTLLCSVFQLVSGSLSLSK